MGCQLKKLSLWSLPLLVTAVAVVLLRNYFFPPFQIILCLLIAPFVLSIKEKQQRSSRYFFISLLFFTAYCLVCTKLFLFFGLGSLLLYSIESRFGKTGLLCFIFLICISPALHYAVNTFTFTLRLNMSAGAAGLLNYSGFAVENNGNYFTLPDGTNFNVDKACLGLNLFNSGLAFTTLLAGIAEKKHSRSFSFLQILLVFFTSCLLLVCANFLRIITIVVFRSMPGTLSHELIGLFSMLVYVLLPVNFLINCLIKYASLENPEKKISPSNYSLKNIAFPLIAFALLFISCSRAENYTKSTRRDPVLEQLVIDGFTRAKKEGGVMEYRKDDLLVYIKPAVKIFESDHPPVLCWQAAGFNVEQVSKIKVAGTTILVAQIRKEKITAYTGWWYDNGPVKTTDQWTWRLSGGEPFRIINVTAPNREELIRACRNFLSKNLF